MKAALIFGLFVLLTLTTNNCFGQEITLTTTSSDIVSSRAALDLPGLAGNPLAIIVATPIGDTQKINPHPIGAWYYNKKWHIFNTDHAVMPLGATYKVQFFAQPGLDQFLHLVTKQHLGGEGSYLDSPALNNNPNAQFKILQNYAPDNRSGYSLNPSEAKAGYNASSGKWYIKNVNGNSLSPNTAYNVVITPGELASSPIPQRSLTPTPTPARVIPAKPITPTALKPLINALTGPCSKETAYQKPGKWAKQKKDDLAKADHTFPEGHYKPILAKAQKVVDLFMKASPEFKGIEASAKRIIRGDSYLPGGALPFGVEVFFGSYICVTNDSSRVKERGQIILSGGYGSTTVYFNSLRDVLESVQEGSHFLTSDGDEIFGFKKALGNFKGFTMIQPRFGDEGHEAIVITPDNRLPYKTVTREQYLQARIKNYGTAELFAADAATLKSMIANMSPAERQSPALVRDITASPGRAKLFVTEAEGGRHLVTIDKSFFNPKLPREAIQFITVRWNWNDRDIPKAEAIRLFKLNFDFEALKQMIGK